MLELGQPVELGPKETAARSWELGQIVAGALGESQSPEVEHRLVKEEMVRHLVRHLVDLGTYNMLAVCFKSISRPRKVGSTYLQVL